MSNKPRKEKRIGLIAILFIVLMAIVPAFLLIGAEVPHLATVNQMFIVGLVMTIFYSSWNFNKTEPVNSKTLMSQSAILIFGVSAGLITVAVNAVLGTTNLLLGQLDPTNAYLIMLAAVAEELFFRGFLQNFFNQWLNSLWCVLPSAIIFALFHYFAYGLDYGLLLVMFGIGLCFGIAYEMSGDIGAPMLAHGVNNGMAGIAVVGPMFNNMLVPMVVIIGVLVISYIVGANTRRRK